MSVCGIIVISVAILWGTVQIALCIADAYVCKIDVSGSKNAKVIAGYTDLCILFFVWIFARFFVKNLNVRLNGNVARRKNRIAAVVARISCASKVVGYRGVDDINVKLSGLCRPIYTIGRNRLSP